LKFLLDYFSFHKVSSLFIGISSPSFIQFDP
jgi:hypothetical protein